MTKNSRIIDVGGCDSTLVYYLLQEGFHNITVMDISEVAINEAKARLGDRFNWLNGSFPISSNFKPMLFSTCSTNAPPFIY